MEKKASIEIDSNSGFCFGVVNAIRQAEIELDKGEVLYCLGDIVHNSKEVERLRKKGLITINHDQFRNLRNAKVLLRAHGEPPETYETARKNNIHIIDATCPVVLKLQQKIKTQYISGKNNTQIVIYGKHGHAEVNGLVGQTNGEAIVVETPEELQKVSLQKNIKLFSQTTKSLDGFGEIVQQIHNNISPEATFEHYDTICRQVANRMPNIRKFAARHDLILFVSGKKSSNGKILYEECKKENLNTHFITSSEEVNPDILRDARSIGICGATSTPFWLMEEVADHISKMF